MNLIYLGTEILEVVFKKKIVAEKKIELETSIQYSVNYSDTDQKCIGDVDITIQDSEHKDYFTIKYHSLNLFEYSVNVLDDDIKKQIHLQIANELFPFWNSTVSGLCTLCGIPPIRIPMKEILEKDIKMG